MRPTLSQKLHESMKACFENLMRQALHHCKKRLFQRFVFLDHFNLNSWQTCLIGIKEVRAVHALQDFADSAVPEFGLTNNDLNIPASPSCILFLKLDWQCKSSTAHSWGPRTMCFTSMIQDEAAKCSSSGLILHTWNNFTTIVISKIQEIVMGVVDQLKEVELRERCNLVPNAIRCYISFTLN